MFPSILSMSIKLMCSWHTHKNFAAGRRFCHAPGGRGPNIFDQFLKGAASKATVQLGRWKYAQIKGYF